jgi:hypothetical protein
MRTTIAAVVPARSENISILSVKITLLIREYITEVGVTADTKYVGFPCTKIGYPVLSLSPIPKSYTALPGIPSSN